MARSTGLLAVFITLFLHLLLFASPSSAAPIDDEITVLAKRYEGTPSGKKGSTGPAKSDYPTDAEIRKAFTHPTTPYVFFAGIPDSTPAYQFSKTIGGQIFRDAFPAGYTNKGKRSQEWYQDFADRFSGIFAEGATGDVYFVSNWNLNGHVDSDRVWSRLEYPTIQKNSKVHSVILVDYTNFKQKKVIWPPSLIKNARDEEAEEANEAFEVDGELEDQHWKRGSYQSGWCGLHFTQYQKHQGPGNDTSKYRFDVIVKDSKGATIGETKGMVVGDHSKGGVYSALPKVLIVKPGGKDRDHIGFAYDGAHWDTGRHNRRHWCKVGRYDSGARQGDCGFTCN